MKQYWDINFTSDFLLGDVFGSFALERSENEKLFLKDHYIHWKKSISYLDLDYIELFGLKDSPDHPINLIRWFPVKREFDVLICGCLINFMINNTNDDDIVEIYLKIEEEEYSKVRKILGYDEGESSEDMLAFMLGGQDA